MMFEYAAISAVVGLLALTATLLVHVIKYGEEKGAMRERVKRLEQEMIDQKSVRDVVMRLEGTVDRFGITMDQFQDYMTHLFTDNVPQRNRNQQDANRRGNRQVDRD